jgi:hypothetical protein
MQKVLDSIFERMTTRVLGFTNSFQSGLEYSQYLLSSLVNRPGVCVYSGLTLTGLTKSRLNRRHVPSIIREFILGIYWGIITCRRGSIPRLALWLKSYSLI